MDKVLVLDFGGQYDQLIARRIRNQNVYAEIRNCDDIELDELKQYKGIVFTGGPNSVYDESSPKYDKEILNLNIPILGICYGHQLIAYLGEGKINSSENNSEYGKTLVHLKRNILFKDIPEESISWMSHTDYVERLPEGFEISGYSEKCPCVAMANDEKKIYGVQFHPEVTHTEYGTKILQNFIFEICGCKADWQMDDFLNASVEKYRNELKDKKVLLGLSGGVDSLVTAVLLNKAIGKNLVCVMIDHGLLRKDEADSVEKVIKEKFDINLIRVDAKDRFLEHLKGVTDPEKKRKVIGEDFIRAFEEEANKLSDVKILAQGTIYPDVIESGKGKSATIKSHHNVGGLPENMLFEEIVEPLRTLFKDEVRQLGITMGIPRELVYRQPFPGPGLAVRIIGEITEEKLDMLKEADSIFREEVDKAGIDSSQYFAVLTDSKAVGVKGDERAYGYVVALRAVSTDDFMTAEWMRLPYEILELASNRITNEIKGVTRVVYDITSKPPGTIEWE